MRKLHVFLLLTILLCIISCNYKQGSWWREPEVAVMADSTDWGAVQGQIRSNFERVIRTPQIEKTLSVRHVKESEFMRYTSFRYLLLVATLQSEGRVGKIVQKLVSDPEVRRRVETGENTVFAQNNPWAKDQIMAIVVGRDIDALQQALEIHSHFLYNMFYMDFDAALKEDMFHRNEGLEESNRLMTAYGWKIRLQKDYFRVQEFPGDGFIWYRRLLPERWIFVRWVEGGDSSMLDNRWVISERNRIGALYYGGDKISDKYLYSQPGKFLGNPAQITTGLWENDEAGKGGPFKNYTFYEPLTRRTYMIDIAVHAPGRNKAPFLRRMEVIARSFRTVFDSEEESDK